MLGHEVDRVGRGHLRGDHKVALVLAVLGIREDDHAAVAQVVDDVADGRQEAPALGIGDRLIAFLPNFLQFGYMPGPADVTSQAVPDWVVVTCALTMAAGTAAGGWRIIRTLGHKMVKLQPVHGFAAETTADPRLRVALERSIDEQAEEEALSESLVALEEARR